VAVPALVAGVLAGFLGWVITSLSCTSSGANCPLAATLVGLASFVAAGFGMTIVVVLLYRSIAEQREKRAGPET
jgi:hypothetical protein